MLMCAIKWFSCVNRGGDFAKNIVNSLKYKQHGVRIPKRERNRERERGREGGGREEQFK